MKKMMMAAGAALALIVGAGGAQAATYNLGTVTPTVSATSNTLIYTGGGTDYFTFMTTDPYEAFVAAAIKNAGHKMINDITLSLFAGTPTAPSGAALASVSYDPLTQPAQTLDTILNTAGSYFVEADVTTPKGDQADYNVAVSVSSIAAAPEPAAWALMLGGVGLAGLAFRRSRRYRLAGATA